MGKQLELPWVHNARLWIGTKEIAGIKHNPKIVGIWPAIGINWFNDDETPWCAGAMTLWLKQAREQAIKAGSTVVPLPPPGPKFAARALSYADYGSSTKGPAYGAIAVKERKGGGHVTLVVGRYSNGLLACLGANQDDQVKISPYHESAFKTFRWPTGKQPSLERYDLPVLELGKETSGGREA